VRVLNRQVCPKQDDLGQGLSRQLIDASEVSHNTLSQTKCPDTVFPGICTASFSDVRGACHVVAFSLALFSRPPGCHYSEPSGPRYSAWRPLATRAMTVAMTVGMTVVDSIQATILLLDSTAMLLPMLLWPKYPIFLGLIRGLWEHKYRLYFRSR